MRAAAVQLNSTGDKARNLAAAERLVRAAAADGAELVALPEKWNLLADGEELVAGAEPLDGPSLTAARGWARELGIHLLAGSISERGEEKAFNTSVLIGPDGEDLAVYRKIHMFDVDAGGVSYRESAYERPGEEIVTAPLGEIDLGLAVCYDLRFPELFRDPRPARAPASSPCPPPSPAPPAATTGRCCCGRGRSRTRSSSLAPEPGRHGAAALRLLRPLGDRRPLGPAARRRRRRASASSPPTSTSPSRTAIRESLPSLANRRPEAYAHGV